MRVSPISIIFGITCGLLCGAAFFVQAVHVFEVRNAPIVTGHIVLRKPIREFSVPRADFTILIDGKGTEVHAHVQRYLMSKVPDRVSFHYSGDPARTVFLFEHENNPYLLVVLLWGSAVFLLLLMVRSRHSARIRRMLGLKDASLQSAGPKVFD